MGSQVSSNLKHALLLESYKKKNSHNHTRNKQDSKDKQIIGILSFEVANVLSKSVHLHRSLTDSEISKLKNEILKSEGVKNLVSTDESYLLELALAEKLDDLNRVANVVSRLGKKCVEPALQGFEHVYGDIVDGVIDVRELGFLVKDMEGMVKKMERYVNATSNLYCELEVLNELEQSTKKFRQNQHEESRRVFEQKFIWQKQDVRHLKEISLWNQTYDKCCKRRFIGAVEGFCSSPPMKDECREVSGNIGGCHGSQRVSGPLRRAVSKRSSKLCQSGPIERAMVEKRETYMKPRDPFRESSASKFDDDDSCVVIDEDQRSQISRCYSVGNARLGGMTDARFGPKSRLMAYAPPSTIGGSALALHYANVIIVIEKLLRYPHLVGEEARDDLYQMLPTSLRMSLRTHLKSYAKNLAIYDAPLAHDWKETLDGILRWLAPLAHNFIRWQSERNFEQHQIVNRTNVLLLQTLYFADRGKTEAAICELLVGMNYICRYEHQQNALLDCASSFDYEDCMQWQLQCRASFVN
ncbi:PLANT/PROTEIN (DUF668) [Salix viminalis]|uniref:PLANT/PROTEIN (DUF668) n=2 Tax=Salix TaxID=40685 RepID=A0A9Q0U1M0_SALVM|nr:PLANT/PROTEIN (DUF668) [Salix viminalis]